MVNKEAIKPKFRLFVYPSKEMKFTYGEDFWKYGSDGQLVLSSTTQQSVVSMPNYIELNIMDSCHK